MRKKSKYLRAELKKMSNLLGYIFSGFINTVGLILSILSMFYGDKPSQTEYFITIILIIAELFLVLAVISSVITFIKNLNSKDIVADKRLMLLRHREANKTIFDNQKTMITCYKDFEDRLSNLVKKYTEKFESENDLDDQLEKLSVDVADDEKKEKISDGLHKIKRTMVEEIRGTLIEQYNRFMANILDPLREDIEEYLSTKECNIPVSITVKQLEKPLKYSELDDAENNIYTAFRDGKTYGSKRRNETWEKKFSIKKNSNFITSVEKDYCIFHNLNKKFLENSFYLNESVNFYELYNSGVTCTIYSCVGSERVLYGFLACDSLVDEKLKKERGDDIYDYNVANMLMTAAHIIAMYLNKFLQAWEKCYIESEFKIQKEEKKKAEEKAKPVKEETVEEKAAKLKKEKDEFKAEYALCAQMVNSVNKTRYKS